ncbi:MAG: flavodoxin family protein [Odoribacteraceae bacterium]|jgi:multimeric flavodoxin WrbA|nr:flavodoxin family protein [Odoribacteraceae bacterium]
MNMKVIAFNGSPKREGNTCQAIKTVAGELAMRNIEVEIVHVGNKPIRGCMACGQCAKSGDNKCVISDDEVNEWIAMMLAADGVILASPVYFAGINGTMKSFLDRAAYVIAHQQGAMRYKVGTALVAVRRAGGSVALDTLHHYIQFFEMLSPASNYWNIVHGRLPGEVLQDNEGQQIMRVLGRNMAWLMHAVEQGKRNLSLPDVEEKISTHFIR